MFRQTTRKTYSGYPGFSEFIDRQMGKFDKCFDSFDRLFDAIQVDSIKVNSSDNFGPVIKIEVGSSGGLVLIELPGIAKELLSVEMEGEIITVSVDHEFTGFTKTFRVDTTVFDMNTLKAGYENGLLTLTLSRRDGPDVEDKRTIPIE